MIYATKFIFKVREEDVEKTESLLKSSVLPELVERGYAEPVVIGRSRRIDRSDRRKAKAALEELSRKMLEVAQVYEPNREGDLASLRYGLMHGVNSHAHGMIHHHKKNKRPREYELLRRELYKESNREIVRGVQLDIYVSHSGRDPSLPSILKILEEKLGSLLFLKPKAIEYTVFQRSLSDESGYALQTFVAVSNGKRGDDPRDVKAHVRSLIEDLAEEPRMNGFLALKSLREGVSEGSRWHPNGIGQHRGDESGLEAETTDA